MSSCLNSRIERFRMASQPALGMSVSVRGAGPARLVDAAAVSFLPLEPAGRVIIAPGSQAGDRRRGCPAPGPADLVGASPALPGSRTTELSRQITHCRGECWSDGEAAWSPGGDRIAF